MRGLLTLPLLVGMALAGVHGPVAFADGTAPKPAPAKPTIGIVPFANQPTAGAKVKVSGPEFEILRLENYDGPVTWDVAGLDGVDSPVKLFKLSDKKSVVGFRPGSRVATEYEVPNTSPTVAVFAAGTGKAVISAWGLSDGLPAKITSVVVEASTDVIPTPPGPVPPGPTPPGPIPPGPTPPTPTPPPIPSVPGAGLYVMIVEESADRSKLPAKQLAILTSSKVRNYLNTKCATSSGGTKEWRIYDKDTSTEYDSQIWRDAMKRNRGPLPWIVISNGTTGFEGPLPANEDETVELLKRYGG